MYKGDVRIVNVDIFVDDIKHKSWTSSGTTTDFERIELSATGKTIELSGVLDESEWLSITEVRDVVGTFKLRHAAQQVILRVLLQSSTPSFAGVVTPDLPFARSGSSTRCWLM